METNRALPVPVTTGAGGLKMDSIDGALIENSFSEFMRRLWSARWTLLKVTAAGAALAFLIGLLQTPLHLVHASLEVQAMDDKFSDYSSDSGSDTSIRALSDVQTQIRILTSHALVERALNKLPEADREKLLSVSRFGWKKLSFDESVDNILKRLEARPSAQARIIDVTFQCRNAVAGAAFVNGLVQELADYTLERRWKTSQRTQAWLERGLDDFRQKLEQSEREAEDYARASGVAAASARNFDQRPQPAARTTSNAAALVASDQQLKALRGRLAVLNKQLDDLSAIYSPQNQVVIKVQEQINATRAAYDKRKSVVTASARERGPQALEDVYIEPVRPAASEDAAKLAHYNTLQREVEANRHLFDTMTARVKEASVASAMQASNILVVDPAYPNPVVSRPNQWLYGLFGALIGLFAGLVYVSVKHRMSSTFAGPANVSRYLGIPLLGAIPIDRYTRKLPVTPPGTERAPMLHLAFDKGLQTAESYRSIRSSILRSLEQRTHPWRLLFISAGTTEGKTSVICNLGAALAGAQRRVLLVDGDLRHPTLHQIFGMENENGLVEFLGKQLPASAADSRQLIRATQIPGLYVLTAGRPGVNAPEILASSQLSLLLSDLMKGFDLVLLDSPPILPYSDARSLARQADGVILVVRANVTERQAAIKARDTLAQDGADIVGAILTEWNADADTLRFQTGYKEAV